MFSKYALLFSFSIILYAAPSWSPNPNIMSFLFRLLDKTYKYPPRATLKTTGKYHKKVAGSKKAVVSSRNNEHPHAKIVQKTIYARVEQ
jgi:hypothetical protein